MFEPLPERLIRRTIPPWTRDSSECLPSLAVVSGRGGAGYRHSWWPGRTRSCLEPFPTLLVSISHIRRGPGQTGGWPFLHPQDAVWRNRTHRVMIIEFISLIESAWLRCEASARTSLLRVVGPSTTRTSKMPGLNPVPASPCNWERGLERV